MNRCNYYFLTLLLCLTSAANDLLSNFTRYPNSTQFTRGNSLITIGQFTYTADDLNILEYGEGAYLSIGKFCSIAPNVTFFLGGNHRADWVTTFPFGHIYENYFEGKDIVGHPTTKGNIVVGNDVWIGRNVSIMSGVTVGDGAIIGAHAVVTKNVAPYEIVAGNPAKHIKYRFDKNMCVLLQKLQWWDLEVSQIKEIIHDLCSLPNEEKLIYWLKKYRNIE